MPDFAPANEDPLLVPALTILFRLSELEKYINPLTGGGRNSTVGFIHHPLDVHLPCLCRHIRINGPCEGVTFGAFYGEDFVGLLHLFGIFRYLELVRAFVRCKCLFTLFSFGDSRY